MSMTSAAARSVDVTLGVPLLSLVGADHPPPRWTILPVGVQGRVAQEDRVLAVELACDVVQPGRCHRDLTGPLAHGSHGGELDFGFVGTRAFADLGIHAFDALTAPFLVDSYPCRRRCSTATSRPGCSPTSMPGRPA
jgi:hypothetical protein